MKKIIISTIVVIVAIIGSIYAYNLNQTKDCCKTKTASVNTKSCEKENCVCSDCKGNEQECEKACQENNAKACCSSESLTSTSSQNCSNSACDTSCTCGDECKGSGCDCGCSACKK